MPKRANDINFKVITKKLKMLEKEILRSRRDRRNRFQLSSSSSASSSKSSSSSSESSRASTPTPPENPDNQEETTNPDEHANTITVDPTSMPVTNSIAPAEDLAVSPVDQNDNTDILNILGADLSITVEYGPDINKDVASRFAYIATSGLNKDGRKELLNKFLVPSNCTTIAAPLLNAEIKAATTEQVHKRDKAIESRQKQLAACISGLGKIISEQLEAKDRKPDLLKDLMDVSRIFCDIQHAESEARRNFALYSVKKDLKDQLSTTKIDKYLFGNDLAETLKAAKSVTKSSSDLKLVTNSKPKTSATTNKAYKNLNWKARIPARKQVRGPPPQQASPATRTARPQRTSSQAYSQRHKRSRYQ